MGGDDHHHRHGHAHSCEKDSEGAGHSPESGIEYSLYTQIDIERVQCLNEAEDDSAKQVFKPWECRLDYEKFVESDADPELLFKIPFTANVKLKGIVVIGENSESHPARMRLYKNKPDMTFTETSLPADQEFEMQKDITGTLEYATKIVTFSSVTHLTIHFPINFGNETTKIYYIGLRGEFSPPHRHGVTICTYESSPNVADHKTNAFDCASKEIQ